MAAAKDLSFQSLTILGVFCFDNGKDHGRRFLEAIGPIGGMVERALPAGAPRRLYLMTAGGSFNGASPRRSRLRPSTVRSFRHAPPSEGGKQTRRA
jgi:hypothetical protein